MKLTNIFFSLLMFTVMTPVAIYAQQDIQLPGNLEGAVLDAVEGFGLDSTAGQGGRIIRVTNLNADGPGSLAEALKAGGPRIVIFELGGIIDLRKTTLTIETPFLTLAGQTAPSPGITIIRGGIKVSTHDVLIQHISVRPGDAGMPKENRWVSDAIATNGRNAYNIVIDHCSLSWATDENLSVSGPRLEGPDHTSHNVTFSNCIIAEGLTPHSKGSLIHDCCRNVAIIGNLYANNAQRNPYFKAHTTGVIVNNLIYNPGIKAIKVSLKHGQWKGASFKPERAKIAAVSNVMIKGNDTPEPMAIISGRGDVYMQDNVALDKNGNPAPIRTGDINVLSQKPVWPTGLKPLPAKKVIDYVIKNAGARPKDRNNVDKRIINDFLQRTGRIINSQQQVGGYPKTATTYRKLSPPESNVNQWLKNMTRQVQ